MEVTGVPEYVIVSGRVCVDECELKAVHGFGKYVNTDPFGAYVYDMINDKEKVWYTDLVFIFFHFAFCYYFLYVCCL